MPLTEDEIKKMKVKYVHIIIDDMLKEQNFKAYALGLKRLNEFDKIFKENNLRTVITVSTETLLDRDV